MGDSGSGLESVVHFVRVTILVFRQTITSFTDARGAQAAAGIAYYAFFSLFPLLLVLVVAGSYFIEAEDAVQTLLDIAGQVLPVSTNLLEGNVNRILSMRTSFGIVGLVSLVWSATGVFSALAFNINLAWKGVQQRTFIQKRLVGLVMVGVLAFLYLSFLVVTITIKSLARLQVIFTNLQYLEIGTVARGYNFVSTWVVVFLLYLALYRWVPSARVRWKPAVYTAALSMVMWHLVSNGFTWFIRMGFSSYELVYGTLGTVVALLFLIYLNAWIVLFGAHLCAAIQFNFELEFDRGKNA